IEKENKQGTQSEVRSGFGQSVVQPCLIPDSHSDSLSGPGSAWGDSLHGLTGSDWKPFQSLGKVGPEGFMNSGRNLKYLGLAQNYGSLITIERDSNEDVSDPKHGKEDPDNMPHVGGNTWAGGTGGRDTAGLGGKGGPYRLDAGHPVYQVSEVEKDAVPEHVKRAAREMAQKAFQQRLKEIQMSEYDAATYERFSGAVQRQVHALRVILDNLQAKGKERQWLRHQATGELDDAKIIDGLAGEKAIYKRRGDLEPQLGSPQQKPKRLRLVVDVSGSMYRFNGVDRRLERSMEAVCMVMEAFENYEEKFKYDIAGHSGDGYNIRLVSANKIPKDNKQRLEILKTMHAHSQFCMSGDHTLEGTEHAIKDITKEEADEYFVIILSDANLSRYGINPARFAQILTSDPQVNAFAIFIGSLGDQAARLQRTLPAGRSFVAMDTQKIPQILQQIFTSTMLSKAPFTTQDWKPDGSRENSEKTAAMPVWAVADLLSSSELTSEWKCTLEGFRSAEEMVVTEIKSSRFPRLCYHPVFAWFVFLVRVPEYPKMHRAPTHQ
ncbi:LOW QUALITY PROTEIN: hypothetical protein U0070_013245, partial [Myodes glareolus]